MSEEQWWVVTFGDMLHWARLTPNEDGSADVFSANGETEHFPNEDEARTALLDADYRAFDGIDEDDAELMGFDLDSVAPPRSDDEDDLLEQMTMKLPPR
jgi:hypothetical protein